MPGSNWTDRGTRLQLAAVGVSAAVRLHYLAAGEGDTVVFLHGGLGDCWSWASQMSSLAAHFRVIAYSRRHAFPNANPRREDNYSCRIDADDLGRLLQSLACARAHLVGTSYGALTALCFALKRPDAVASLLLVEPPVLGWLDSVPTGNSARQAFLRTVWQPAGAFFQRGERLAAMQLLHDGMRGQGRFDLMSSDEASRMLRNSSTMERLVCSTDPFPCLPLRAAQSLEMPILLVTGEHTVPLHLLCHKAARRVLGQASEAVIPNAGHAPASENATGFNRVLCRFLSTR